MPVIVCHACDLAHRAVESRVRCARCRAPLRRSTQGRIDVPIALALCAVVFWLLGNLYPLVVIQVNGVTRSATLSGAALGLSDQGYHLLAALVFLTTVIAPALQISALLYLLIPLRQQHRARGQTLIFRTLAQVRPWTFMEVFMLGALVALVRLSEYARVLPGVALWSCACLMFCLSALTSLTSPEQFWRWVERCRE